MLWLLCKSLLERLRFSGDLCSGIGDDAGVLLLLLSPRNWVSSIGISAAVLIFLSCGLGLEGGPPVFGLAEGTSLGGSSEESLSESSLDDSSFDDSLLVTSTISSERGFSAIALMMGAGSAVGVALASASSLLGEVREGAVSLLAGIGAIVGVVSCCVGIMEAASGSSLAGGGAGGGN